jgi:hypothetical protein
MLPAGEIVSQTQPSTLERSRGDWHADGMRFYAELSITFAFVSVPYASIFRIYNLSLGSH